MASPVQVILNPENFEEVREAGGGGLRRDFYAFQDGDFRTHRSRLSAQVRSIADVLEAQPFGGIGYIRVILRRDAWAKSHRPINTLFRSDRTPLVGGGDLGEMIFEVNPVSLRQIAANIDMAEDNTRLKYIEKLGKDLPNPSGRRSETGAILSVDLYGAEDRRSFSLEEGVAWLSNPITGSSYEVELFELPIPRNKWDTITRSRVTLYDTFLRGLAASGAGLTAHAITSPEKGPRLLAVRLGDSEAPPTLRLSSTSTERRRELAPFDANTERHRRLLAFLDKHPLVRRVELPGLVVRSAPLSLALPSKENVIPVPDAARSYPKMGVIDGGIADVMNDWILERWDILADEHIDEAHGTFIGGLAVAGMSMNGGVICRESDGCNLVDIAVFPSEKTVGTFQSYYPEGLPQFLDEVETAVADARAKHGVRVFNMSLNVLQEAGPSRYSSVAARIDAIADTYNVLIVISAGNTNPTNHRFEWPVDKVAAMRALATAREDGLLIPAESARAVAVGALNPPGVSGCIPHAPARYSRRGPGLRAGMKPDLAHFGGSGSPPNANGHGLLSVSPSGTVLSGCGTSYAAPLVARTAATLDHLIEGEISRETLAALLLHRAELPSPIKDKEFAGIARHMAGFGTPPSAEQILVSDDHEATLVFASRIRRGHQLAFRFSWPASLVGTGNRCRGYAKLTLVTSPPVDSRYGAEHVRINVEAALQQEDPDGGSWTGQLDSVYLPNKAVRTATEAEQIEHGFKWSPVKVFERRMPKGVGKSSSWRLFVDYLTRAGEEMPEDGVPFTAILTIRDIDNKSPVFNDMRQSLLATGVQLSDIRTAARVTTRV